MVENNEISNIIQLLSSITLQILSKDLRKILRRIERNKDFYLWLMKRKLKKIYQNLMNLFWKSMKDLRKEKKLRKMTYTMWKTYMLDKFERNISIGEFLREHQRKEVSGRQHLERMRSLCEKLFENEDLFLDVAYCGMPQVQ
ncbi:hypothetical protein NGRA_3024 [Nosema granulosis]|uniref:Uncharacterized protein n=1 Tax=Nosema granulosis TaxID=83296 RepID=A0A9P6GVK1_9MICR|nr:hypothetical protein NGRA_3024 [Nosema granulosis]